MGEHIDQYQNIARLFRRLADAFDEDTPTEDEIPF